jgi:solute carrier family 10 (sodium/bile acid cotransporter), member 7
VSKASVEKRLRSDGTAAYRVVWREPGTGRKQFLTVDDRRQAEQTVKLLDANGQQLSVAIDVAKAIQGKGPTVGDVVEEHISLLNRVGIGLTPLILTVTAGSAAGMSWEGVGRVALQLAAPFVLGVALSSRLGPAARRHARVLSVVDRAVIVALVYLTFSRGTRSGLWQRTGPDDLLLVLLVCLCLLSVTLAAGWVVPRLWTARRTDRLSVMFCGSNKSLATGLPMAAVLVPPAVLDAVVLPLLIYHPLQIAVCIVIATAMASSSRTEG